MVSSTLLVAVLLHFLPQFSCLAQDLSLSYNGGKIMTQPISLYLLWFGNGWPESGREAILNSITSLTRSRYPDQDFDVPTLGNWWDVVRQYRDSSSVPGTDSINVGAECFYTGNQINVSLEKVDEISFLVFNQSLIDGFGGNLSCSRVFEVGDNSIYLIMFSHNVIFSNDLEQREMIKLCRGSFAVKVYEEITVKMVWIREPQNPTDQCSTSFHGNSYLGPPNGDEKIDSLVGFLLAELADEVTNRDGKGWTSNDGNGLTVTSSCASSFQRDMSGNPMFMDIERNVSFNAIGLNGYRYMVKYIWDQNIRNCVLKLSDTCGSDDVILKESKGYLKRGIVVNHTDGLQPYAPNQKCRWEIQLPTAKFISFTFNYLSIAADSDDQFLICQSDSSNEKCSNILSDSRKSNMNFKLMSSKAYIQFTTSERVSFESKGWELGYSAGFCNGNEDVYEHDGIISYASSSSFSYVEGLNCHWILHGKPGTPVFLSFTSINISKDLDFLAIYNGTGRQIANLSGFYLGSDLPQMNLTGRVTVVFYTQSSKGEGWSAEFYISSPDSRDKKGWLVTIVVVVALSFSLAFIAIAILRKRRKCGKNLMESSREGILRKRRKCGKNSMESSHEGLMLIKVKREKETKIGEGTSAIVYRAELADGNLVAIKSPRIFSSQTEKEEEILLKASSHPSIISVLGCAQDGLHRRYLVFEFMGKGNLSQNLIENGETMDWEKRLIIALRISSAVQMLHMYIKPPIFHGNITSENILLDEFCNAKLGGFGAANYCQNNSGNMAEDIWSFGLLLVEILRGKPLANRNYYRNVEKFEEIDKLVGRQECLDKRLEIPNEKCKIVALMKFGDIARWCITSSWIVEGNENYPKIGDVLSSLKQVKKLYFSSSS